MAKINILIAEDELILAIDIKRTLEKIGYNVVKVVSSGEDAIEYTAQLRPDLVLMDITLQGNIDGTVASEKIASIEIPVVFLTSYSDERSIKLAKRSSPYGYLVKPFTESTLELVIRTALKRHKQHLKNMDDAKTDAIAKHIPFLRRKRDYVGYKDKSKIKILIVEDEFILAMDLKRTLEQLGFLIVGIVTSGENALDSVNRYNPDFVLLDVVLQGNIDGIQLSKILNKRGYPFIFLTAYSDEKTVDSALESAPYGYLVKPYTKQLLNTTLEIAIEKIKSEHLKRNEWANLITSKQDELVIEKTGVILFMSIFIVLSIMGFYFRDMMWLAYLLFIPSIYSIFICFFSLRPQIVPDEFEYPPFVSILIPAHNEEFTIERCVRSLSSMEYYFEGEPNFEIIVVNDGSQDNTGEILEKLKEEIPILKIVTRKPPRAGQGKGYVLNDGVQIAKGDMIAVFDADSRVEPDFLKLIIPYLNEENVVAVQSKVRMYNSDENFLTKMQDAEFTIFGNVVLKAKDMLNKSAMLGGNGQITKREFISRIGGWDGFAITEDLNLSIKLMLDGYDIRYCGDVSVWQEAVSEWKPFFRQRKRWIMGNMETLFVYFDKILFSDMTLIRKVDALQYLFLLLFILFVMLAYIVFIFNFFVIYPIQINISFTIAIISTIAFFPAVIIGFYRDSGNSLIESLILGIEYWMYCFYLIPLFLMAFISMIFRKERKWAKTTHIGDKK